MVTQGGTTMLAQGRDGLSKTAYESHQPEQTLLYQLVEAHYPALVDNLAQQGKPLPVHVHREFEAYLKCGRLEHGFLRVRYDKCHFERLVALSCKRRGFCPSCGARRMAETAALLSDEVFPDVPLRQWVISFPFPLRYLFAAHPQAMGKVLGIVYRAISTHLIHKAGLQHKDGATGAVTLIQRFGWYGIPAALSLNIHFHILLLDGVYVYRDNRPPRFQRIKALDKGELESLTHLISQRVGRCLERRRPSARAQGVHDSHHKTAGSPRSRTGAGGQGYLKLTTARYFTPDGRSIQAKGIVPDILVERAQLTAYKPGGRVTEADLSGHLDNSNGETKTKRTRASSAKAASELLASDNQLYEALTLLKEINILGMRNKKPDETVPGDS